MVENVAVVWGVGLSMLLFIYRCGFQLVSYCGSGVLRLRVGAVDRVSCQDVVYMWV